MMTLIEECDKLNIANLKNDVKDWYAVIPHCEDGNNDIMIIENIGIQYREQADIDRLIDLYPKKFI